MTLIIAFALGLIALLYATVGHGGASGYLAVLALSGRAPEEVRATALLLNVLVSSIGVWRFAGSVAVRWSLWARFAVSAAPCALLAGAFGDLNQGAFNIGVAIVLLFAAWRLAIPAARDVEALRPLPKLGVALPIGACIGVASGLIGVGGGIFLSPLLLLMRWAGARETAAISAAFILLSSLAGLVGVAIQYGEIPINARDFGLFAVAALIGGWVGATIGAGALSGLVFRRLLAAALIIAALKLTMRAIEGS